jgi:hypothetical protein
MPNGRSIHVLWRADPLLTEVIANAHGRLKRFSPDAHQGGTMTAIFHFSASVI